MTSRGDDRAPASERLPELLAFIEDVAGHNAMLDFAMRFGGTSVYLPKQYKPAHPIVEVLGPLAAHALIEAYGHGKIAVPQGPTSALSRRAERIRELLASGASSGEITRLLRCSPKTVQRIRNRDAA